MSPSGPVVIATRAFLMLSFLSGTWTRAEEPKCSEGICIHEIKDASSVHFEVENTRFFDISLNFTVTESENVDTLETFRLTHSIAARSRTPLTTLRQVDPRARWSYKYKWEYAMGDPDAKPDDSFRYGLPYAATDAKVVLADSVGEFLPGPSRYEVLFDMPAGTTVLAARPGVVCQVIDGFPEGSLDPEAMKRSNIVTVRHADGTYGAYSHLKAGGLAVREGTVVAAGQRLALSGASGYTARPSLGFMVWKAIPGGTRTSLPIQFDSPLVHVRPPERTPLATAAGGATATLRVKCSEQDCGVLLRGAEVGKANPATALVLSVPADQQVVLRVKKDGFLEHGEILYLEAGRIEDVFAKLVPIPEESLVEARSGARPWLGVEVIALTPDISEEHGYRGFKGVVVAKVVPGSPAETAGLSVDDLIMEFDGKPVKVPLDFTRLVDRLTVGQRVPFGILRKGEFRKLRATVGQAPTE